MHFPVSSHRQQLRYKESMSHPNETHHPAERVWWSFTAMGPLLSFSLSIFSRPAHCWKGQMWGQGRYGGRRWWRGRWRRWWRGWAGRGRGTVPLRGQGCRWLQCVVQMSKFSEGGVRSTWMCINVCLEVTVKPRCLCPEEQDHFTPSGRKSWKYHIRRWHNRRMFCAPARKASSRCLNVHSNSAETCKAFNSRRH